MAGGLHTAGAASVAGWVTPNGRLYWSGHGFVQLRHGQLQTGEYLTQHVGLCAECHTPRVGLLQKPDKTRLFAGMKNPPKGFPVKPPNITPDPETGIGRWSEADFMRAMRSGVTPSGQTLNPFMPWPELKRLTDADLQAMFQYLHSVPPVR